MDKLSNELNEIRDQLAAGLEIIERQARVFREAIGQLHTSCEDCKTALAACKQELAAIKHMAIDKETVSVTYHDLADMRRTRVEQLQGQLTAALATIKDLEKELRNTKKKNE